MDSDASYSKEIPLGKNTDYPVQYDKSVLFGISRAEGRQALGIQSADESVALPFYGVDIWNGYELSWLDNTGKPQVAVIRLDIPAESPQIVESKSLKLYLNSLNQTSFTNKEEVRDTVLRDVSEVVGQAITVEIFAPDQWSSLQVAEPQSLCIDDQPYRQEQGDVPSLLVKGGTQIEERLHSNLMRSLCPVTSQPDWASVYFHYKGAAIDHTSLLAYVISYRQHNEFHEQCVERMFMDIQKQCSPAYLCIEARYMRRGGLDINPVRCSSPGYQANNLRGVRQ